MRIRSSIAIALALLLAPACGDDDGTTPPRDAGGGGGDTGTMTGTDSGMMTGTDTGPATGAHCDATDILIAEIVPGSSVTVFNPTEADISVSADLGTYFFCSQPAYPQLSTLDGSATVPAGGTHTFTWEMMGWADTDEGGEVAIYTNAMFGNPASIVDFVCWGTGHAAALSRKDEAEAGGHWSGDCAGAITGDSLARVPGTDGTTAASYDPTGEAAALTCP